MNWANTLAIDIGNECWHHDYIEGQQIGYSIIRGCTIRNAGVCGIAGLFAAITAREAGAEVVLAEKNYAGRSGSSIMGSGQLNVYNPD